MAAASESLRCLVACSRCSRQFDAGGLAAGSRFRCSCGQVLEVPRFRAQDAAVVRCSSCSAPREHGARSCSHCGADYTLHEQDMKTLCPACMARVSDAARYCHRCGTAIAPQGEAGTATTENCPACGPASKLSSRALGRPRVALLECPVCAGLWLGTEAFRLLADHARAAALGDAMPSPEILDPSVGPRSLPGTAAVRSASVAGDAAGSNARPGSHPPPPSFYRPCPECGKRMNRRNFGQTSGIVVDACKEHGLWFDATELSEVLRWIQSGGEKVAAERRADEEREARRREKLNVLKLDLPHAQQGGGPIILFPQTPEKPESSLRDLLGKIFDL